MRKFLIKIFLVAAVAFLAAAPAGAQAIKDIRINEIQVYNTDGYEDDYGHRVGWIELFNAGYSQVDLGGAYIKVRGKEYRIPKNDRRTVIAPRGYMIFFAEGTSSKGTFHTNFTLEETDYLVFYDQSGKGEAIDSLYYDKALMIENVSYGWFEDENGVERLQNLHVTTPMATNNTLDKKPRSEYFLEQDPHGIVMAVTAMAVVFTALLFLYLIFKLSGNFFKRMFARREENAIRAQRKSEAPAVPITIKNVQGMAGEEIAAIALALYQYSEDLHDIENTVLTINRGAKAYSPWSSKIYGLRQLPNKK